MIKHPSCLKVNGVVNELCQHATKTHNPVVLFDGKIFIFGIDIFVKKYWHRYFC